MRLKQVKFWSALAFALALVVTVCPMVRRIIREQEHSRQIAALEARLDTIGERGVEKQRNLAKWYNYHLELGEPGLGEAYNSILDLGNGAMAVLEVPELNLRLPVFHGNAVPVGHDPDSPFPIGGRGNHTVLLLSAQYPWAEGMAVYIECLGIRLSYRLESVQVMPHPWPTDRLPEGGKEFLTLVYDQEQTRTLIRCVRCSEITVRETVQAAPLGASILAAMATMGLAFPALLCLRQRPDDEQNLRICGFLRKTSEKSKLF